MRAVVLSALFVCGCAKESASPPPTHSTAEWASAVAGDAGASSSAVTAACDRAAHIGCEGTVKCCFPTSQVSIDDCLVVARLLCAHEANKRAPVSEREASFDPARAELALAKLERAFAMCPVSLGPESTSLLADAEWAAGRRPLPIGAACTGTACEPTGACDDGHCKARLARGASCGATDRCLKGEHCSTRSHVCEAPGALSGICDPDAPWDERCVDGAFCMVRSGRAPSCAVMLPIGAACASRHDCMSQACSGGDAGIGVCLGPQESDLCRNATAVLHPRPQ